MARFLNYECNVCSQCFEFQQDVERHIQLDHERRGSGHRSDLRQREVEHERRGSNHRLDLGQRDFREARDHDIIVEEQIDQRESRERPVYVEEVEERSSSSDSGSEDEDERDESVAVLLKNFKQEPISLRKKLQHPTWRRILQEMDRDKDTLDMIQESTKSFWSRIKNIFNDINHSLSSLALWNSKLKKVEGTFGSGVFNYFKFLKWSMGLNLLMTLLTVMLIMVPEHYNDDTAPVCPEQDFINQTMFPADSVDACCTNLYLKNQEWKREPLDVTFKTFVGFLEDIGTILLNLVQGDG